MRSLSPGITNAPPLQKATRPHRADVTADSADSRASSGVASPSTVGRGPSQLKGNYKIRMQTGALRKPDRRRLNAAPDNIPTVYALYRSRAPFVFPNGVISGLIDGCAVVRGLVNQSWRIFRLAESRSPAKRESRSFCAQISSSSDSFLGARVFQPVCRGARLVCGLARRLIDKAEGGGREVMREFRMTDGFC